MVYRQVLLVVLVSVLIVGSGCIEMPDDRQSGAGERQAWHEPLDKAAERDLKLTFGMYVTPDPENNPIDPPERFIGYHTALDYEIFPAELHKDVPVHAVCDGEAVYKQYADGYGGTFVQYCSLNGEDVTVLYGHLDLASIEPEVGNTVRAGDEIGVLGDHKSEETSDNRKHLHLGIHKGMELELRGYVQNESELEAYIDPAEVFDYNN